MDLSGAHRIFCCYLRLIAGISLIDAYPRGDEELREFPKNGESFQNLCQNLFFTKGLINFLIRYSE